MTNFPNCLEMIEPIFLKCSEIFKNTRDIKRSIPRNLPKYKIVCLDFSKFLHFEKAENLLKLYNYNGAVYLKTYSLSKKIDSKKLNCFLS